MRHCICTLAALVLIGGFAFPVGAQPDNKLQPARFGWLSEYSSAKALAQKTAKPMMVVIRCVP